MLEVLSRFWDVIAQYPLATLSIATAAAGLGIAVTHFVDRGTIEALRERLAAAKDDLARAGQHKDELMKRLEKHGEDIERLGKQLEAMPRIHVSDEPPSLEGRPDGDLWIQPRRERQAEDPEDGAEDDDEDPEEDDYGGLPEEEEEILRLLADAPSAAEDMASFLGIHLQVARHRCDRLLECGMIDYYHPRVGGGMQYDLTAKGRAYVVKWDLLE